MMLTKWDRQLIRRILALYKSGKGNGNYEGVDGYGIDRLIHLHILHSDAFTPVRTMSEPTPHYKQKRQYPLTETGDRVFNASWYDRLQKALCSESFGTQRFSSPLGFQSKTHSDEHNEGGRNMELKDSCNIWSWL